MGIIDLWKIKYEQLQNHLTDEEYEFLTTHAVQSDDGNWYIDEEMLKDVLDEMKKKEISKLQNLLHKLRVEFKKEETTGLSFNFG